MLPAVSEPGTLEVTGNRARLPAPHPALAMVSAIVRSVTRGDRGWGAWLGQDPVRGARRARGGDAASSAACAATFSLSTVAYPRPGRRPSSCSRVAPAVVCYGTEQEIKASQLSYSGTYYSIPSVLYSTQSYSTYFAAPHNMFPGAEGAPGGRFEAMERHTRDSAVVFLPGFEARSASWPSRGLCGPPGASLRVEFGPR